MKPLIFWHWNRLPSLREADNQIKSFAGRGFGGAVILPERDFLTAAFFESLRGSCRSANRYGTSVFLSDDTGPFSGHGGGEVVSVPEFRAKALLLVPEGSLLEGETPLLKKEGKAVVLRRAEPRNGLCPADVFNPRAAEAFINSVHRRLRREASRFMGYELRGLYSRPALCPEFWGFSALPFSERLSSYINERLHIDVLSSAEELFFGDGELKEKYEALAEELCEEGFRSRLRGWCGENGLEYIEEREVRVIGSAEPMREVNSLFVKGDGLIAADGDAVSLAGAAAAFSGLRPCASGDALWTAAVERLFALSDGQRGSVSGMEAVDLEGQPCGGIELCRIDREASSVYFFANSSDSPVRGLFRFPDSRTARVIDTAAGTEYLLGTGGEIEAELERGGSLTVICGEDNAAPPLPPFTRSGAVFAEFKKPRTLEPVLAEGGENALRLGEGSVHNFEAEYAEGELYAAVAGGNTAELNGTALRTEGCFLDPDFTRFSITGLVRLGNNTLKTDSAHLAFITGDLWTDGKKLLPPLEAGIGDAADSGMPHYAGVLAYAVSLPEELGGKSFLRLRGSFGLAEIKIGLRRERLAAPPYLIPLYSSDGGRTAEIRVSGGLENLLGTAEKAVPFGLYGAELLEM